MYCANGYEYKLSSYFEENSVIKATNSSELTCIAQLQALSAYWQSNYESILAIYWHDNIRNTDIYVNSISFSSIGAGETKTVSGKIYPVHDKQGYLSGYAYAVFTQGSSSGGWCPESGGITTDWTSLTRINPITINSFEGQKITGVFKATYDTVTGENYIYKLRISIPNVTSIQLFENYQSGQQVTLSKSALQLIKQYSPGETVSIGGVIEAYENGVKIGESSEIVITCSSQGDYVKLKINGEWRDAKYYVKINGQWKEAKPYIRINGQWKEGI